MTLPRSILAALLCIAVAIIGHAPVGVGQVPAEDFPFDLRRAEDYGSFRVAVETAWAQWTAAPGLVELRGLSFFPVLDSASTRIFSGGYRAVVALPQLSGVGALSPALEHSRSMIYIHSVGQPSAIPPDSFFESPGALRNVVTERSSNSIRSDSELAFLVTFLNWMETGDPARVLGAIASYAQPGSTWSLSRFDLSRSGDVHEIRVVFIDLLSPTSEIEHRVEATWNGAGFKQVVVR